MTVVAWAVVRMADNRVVHVMPEPDEDAHPEHALGANCWCHPDLSRTPKGELLICHQGDEDDAAA